MVQSSARAHLDILNTPQEACVFTEMLLEKEIVTCSPPGARKPAPRAHLGPLFPLGRGTGSCKRMGAGRLVPIAA